MFAAQRADDAEDRCRLLEKDIQVLYEDQAILICCPSL